MNSILVKKTMDLFNLIYPSLNKFPKYERHCLCQEIRINFYQALKCLSLECTVISKRKAYLQEAEGHILTIQTLFWLARNQKYISKNFQRNLDIKLTEIKHIIRKSIKVN
jgi:predicted DNA-binding ArsR family transcriptional regulator